MVSDNVVEGATMGWINSGSVLDDARRCEILHDNVVGGGLQCSVRVW